MEEAAFPFSKGAGTPLNLRGRLRASFQALATSTGTGPCGGAAVGAWWAPGWDPGGWDPGGRVPASAPVDAP